MNVLILITDQQRADSIGTAYTPNLNEFAKSAVNFNCFAQSPQCQPARCAFWTGRYPSTYNMWWNEMSLSQSEMTLANHLRDIQYETAYFGKWHLDKTVDTLGHFGFDPQNSYLEQDWRKGIGVDKQGALSKREYLGLMKTKSWAGKLSGRANQHDDMVAERAVRFMNQCGDKKFLCAVGFRGPHPPYAAPPPFSELHRPENYNGPEGVVTYDGDVLTNDDWKLIKSQYYGCVSWLDDNIRRILEFVDRKQPNTIVIFTSDHGDMLGDHGCFSKGLYAYEQVIRVPLMIRVPTLTARNYGHITQHIDVAPTVLDLLDQPVPSAMQGKSLVRAMRVGEKVNSLAHSQVGYNPRLKMVRSNRYKYWIYGPDREYLFDLQNDPDETQNLAHERPAILSDMRRNLINCMISAEDPLPVPDPKDQGNQA